jgi:mycothiol synthase
VPIEVRRRAGEDDVAAVSALLRSAAAADQHELLGDHRWLDSSQSERHGVTSFLARKAESSQPVGYAQVQSTRGSFAVEVVVEPGEPDGDESVAALLGAALDDVRRHGGGPVQWWVPSPGPRHDRVAREAGLTEARDLYQMRRALPVEDPAGKRQPRLRTRRFVPGRDEEAFLEVNNRAFSWHPEQGGWDLATLLGREQEPWFDPAGFLLHERDRRLAGFCWTKVHADERPPLGEIYVIAVDPDFQGLGLGRRLVLAGLSYLAGAGLRVGMLYVDASNVAAVHLYEQLGFSIHHVDRAYSGQVPSGSPGG